VTKERHGIGRVRRGSFDSGTGDCYNPANRKLEKEGWGKMSLDRLHPERKKGKGKTRLGGE